MAQSTLPRSEVDAYFQEMKMAIFQIESRMAGNKTRLAEAYDFLKTEWDTIKRSVQTEPLPETLTKLHERIDGIVSLYPVVADNENTPSPFKLGERSPKMQLIEALRDFRQFIYAVNDPIAGYGNPAALDQLAKEVQEVVLRLMGVRRDPKGASAEILKR